jgi:hypothetical protein
LNNTSTYNTERCGDFKVEVNSPFHKPPKKPMPIYQTCMYLLNSAKGPIDAKISINFTSSEEVFVASLHLTGEEEIFFNNSLRNLGTTRNIQADTSGTTSKDYIISNFQEIVIAYRGKKYVSAPQFAFSYQLLEEEDISNGKNTSNGGSNASDIIFPVLYASIVVFVVCMLIFFL